MEDTKQTKQAMQPKKIVILILGVIVLIVLGVAGIIFCSHYFSYCSRNTRALEKRLSALHQEDQSKGKVQELVDLEYDTLYVFEPYDSKVVMERKIGFTSAILEDGFDETCMNYLFVKDNEEVAYLFGRPENIGYSINLKSGAYQKGQIDKMVYEVQTRKAGNSYGKEKTYQDYNFYFEDTIEQKTETVMVQTGNAVNAVPVGEAVTIDLSGEGAVQIEYNVVTTEDSEVVETFTIDGKDFKGQLDEIGMITPSRSNYYIVDLVTADNFKEIALYDEGPSGDPETHFFRYQGGRLIHLGSITDYPDSATCHFQNQGSSQGEIVASFRLSLLQTWFAQGYWKLKGNNQLVFEEQVIYYPIMEYTAQLLCELPVYEEMDKESKSYIMEPGEVTFQATDNKNWVQIKDKTGILGWFYVENYDTIADVGLSAEETFANLQIYD